MYRTELANMMDRSYKQEFVVILKVVVACVVAVYFKTQSGEAPWGSA